MSWASSEGARKTMRANRRRDTTPELEVRRRLHAAGYRYRVDYAPIGGRRRAGIVFTKAQVAIFIDGCFWHSCPEHAAVPKSHADYWGPKLARNVERDRETNASLVASGWSVLRFWEHEDPAAVVSHIRAVLSERSS
ncbi:very short patch repair endonuclease [Microbacterium sp.]|uniref:very short patch repair endonuclease n=1 Tax=Microbacterium sp. TaxID=51671 RepID=UPI003A8D769A